MKVVRQRWSL